MWKPVVVFAFVLVLQTCLADTVCDEVELKAALTVATRTGALKCDPQLWRSDCGFDAPNSADWQTALVAYGIEDSDLQNIPKGAAVGETQADSYPDMCQIIFAIWTKSGILKDGFFVVAQADDGTQTSSAQPPADRTEEDGTQTSSAQPPADRTEEDGSQTSSAQPPAEKREEDGSQTSSPQPPAEKTVEEHGTQAPKDPAAEKKLLEDQVAAADAAIEAIDCPGPDGKDGKDAKDAKKSFEVCAAGEGSFFVGDWYVQLEHQAIIFGEPPKPEEKPLLGLSVTHGTTGKDLKNHHFHKLHRLPEHIPAASELEAQIKAKRKKA